MRHWYTLVIQSRADCWVRAELARRVLHYLAMTTATTTEDGTMTESTDTDTDAAAVDWQTRHDLLLDRYNRLAGEVATLHSTRMVLADE